MLVADSTIWSVLELRGSPVEFPGFEAPPWISGVADAIGDAFGGRSTGVGRSDPLPPLTHALNTRIRLIMGTLTNGFVCVVLIRD
jgi:hypothetical protein